MFLIDNPHISFFSFILFSILSYIIIYKSRNISLKISSFIFFFFNILIFLLFIFSSLSLFWGLEDPIYIEHLTIISQYRYLVLALLGFVFGAQFIYFRFVPLSSPLIKNTIAFISKPFLFEESLKLLETWEENLYGPFFEKIVKKIVYNPLQRFLIFFIHFLLCFFVPILLSIVLVNFAFFHGDFRYFFYLLPLSFISWIYKHFSFYFVIFIAKNFQDMKEFLNISLLKEPLVVNDDFVDINPKDLVFTLSKKALNDFGLEYNYKILLDNFSERIYSFSSVSGLHPTIL